MHVCFYYMIQYIYSSIYLFTYLPKYECKVDIIGKEVNDIYIFKKRQKRKTDNTSFNNMSNHLGLFYA